MNNSKIEWCTKTWNPVTGCYHDCKYCYARRMAHRWAGFLDLETDIEEQAAEFKNKIHVLDEPKVYPGRCLEMCRAPYPFDFAPTFHRYRLEEPAKVKRPQNIFTVDMGDLFGEWVPDEWIRQVFAACEAAPQHNYLFLTKNPCRFGQINGWDHRYNNTYAKQNMWFGTSITCLEDAEKIRKLPYGHANTFLSIEPITGEVDLSFYFPRPDTRWKCSYCGHHTSAYSLHCQNCGEEGGYSGSFRKQPVNWVIIGAETGPGAAAHQPRREWVASIVGQCRAAGVPVFLKNNLAAVWGEDLIQEFPEGLREVAEGKRK